MCKAARGQTENQAKQSHGPVDGKSSELEGKKLSRHREGRTQAEELGDKDQRSHRKNIQETLQNKKQQILTPPHRVSQPTACRSQAAKSKPFKTLRQKILIVLQKYLNKKMLKITLSRY